jgi:hypothetical protein
MTTAGCCLFHLFKFIVCDVSSFTFLCSHLLPYTTEHSEKLELEWIKFRKCAENSGFMLQDTPRRRWHIDFHHMIQKNTEVCTSLLVVVWRFSLHAADVKFPPNFAY